MDGDHSVPDVGMGQGEIPMSRRKEICCEILEQVDPEVLRKADRLLAKLLKKCPAAKHDGIDKVSFSADPDVIRILATYASFGHKHFIETMHEVLDEREDVISSVA